MGDPTLAANMATAPSGKAPYNFYLYNPSEALAITFCLLYFILVPLHFYFSLILSRRTAHPASPAGQHKNGSTILLLIATCLSTAGFGLRAASIQHKTSASLYVLSNLLIIISPIFVCATLYLLLSDLTRRYLPATSLGVKVKTQRFLGLTPKVLSGVFIASDIFSLLTQAGGIIIFIHASTNDTSINTGRAVLLFGLALQIATFALFQVVVFQFSSRTREVMKYKVTADKWSIVVMGMCVAGVLVMVRTLFRTATFAMGVNGYPLRHEWTIYVFDALPIWIALAVMAYSHPGRWLSGVPGEYNLVQADGTKAETRYK